MNKTSSPIDDSEPAIIGSRLKSLPSWLRPGETQLILFLALITLLLHLATIAHDSGLIFDEIHYVPEARSMISDGELINIEHPSLGKLFVTVGIRIFGDNPWGWRVSSVIFAVASTVLLYMVCRELVGKRAAFLATVVFVFENLVFVLSGIAMLEVFSFTFMLLAFLFYLRSKYVLAGLAFALSAVCKMTGVLGVLVVLGYWLYVNRSNIGKKRVRALKRSPRSMVLLLSSAFIGFILLMPIADFAATGEWLNPISRIMDVSIRISGARGAYTPEQLVGVTYPWEWVMIPLAWKDVSLGHHFLWISPTVWILIVPSIAYLTYRWVKTKSKALLFILLWFAITYLLWIPVAVVTDRVMYLYYFYPALGSVCIAIGFALQSLWRWRPKGRFAPFRYLFKVAVIGYLLLHILLFFGLTPVLYAISY